MVVLHSGRCLSGVVTGIGVSCVINGSFGVANGFSINYKMGQLRCSKSEQRGICCFRNGVVKSSVRTVKNFSTLNHTYKWGKGSPHLLVWVLTKKGIVHFGAH